MAILTGRKKELEELKRLYCSGKSELVAVYGRRRVGKTFLVDEAYKGLITFRHAGLSPVDERGKANMLADQLQHFYQSLILQGMKKSHRPDSWLEAFFMLEQWLQQIDNGSRQVIFIDELPWLDTPRSKFLTAFESFWNSWACHRDNVLVVVCGSATSWIKDKLINNHGGLYGRVTWEIKLSPFNLEESEQFFKSRGVRLSRYDIAQCNMILGGIPYYLQYIQSGMSLAQNIDKILFAHNALLEQEYDRLFSSIFNNPEEMKRIIGLLAERRGGYTRKEISEKVGTDNNGYLSTILNSLIASDFIIKYIPFGTNGRNSHYKLIDPYCIFYHKFIKDKVQLNNEFWLSNIASPKISSWRGYAFEELCLRHICKIKSALGISGVSTSESAFVVKGNDDTESSQIDLIIERKDGIVNMCEMKFYNSDYTVTKAYERKIVERYNLVTGLISKKSCVNPVLITTFGLDSNEYSSSFQNVITLDDLF